MELFLTFWGQQSINWEEASISHIIFPERYLTTPFHFSAGHTSQRHTQHTVNRWSQHQHFSFSWSFQAALLFSQMGCENQCQSANPALCWHFSVLLAHPAAWEGCKPLVHSAYSLRQWQFHTFMCRTSKLQFWLLHFVASLDFSARIQVLYRKNQCWTPSTTWLAARREKKLLSCSWWYFTALLLWKDPDRSLKQLQPQIFKFQWEKYRP